MECHVGLDLSHYTQYQGKRDFEEDNTNKWDGVEPLAVTCVHCNTSTRMQRTCFMLCDCDDCSSCFGHSLIDVRFVSVNSCGRGWFVSVMCTM